jgi:hypothetical protein
VIHLLLPSFPSPPNEMKNGTLDMKQVQGLERQVKTKNTTFIGEQKNIKNKPMHSLTYFSSFFFPCLLLVA